MGLINVTRPRLAFDDNSLAEDRSLRSIDADGHMRVSESRISKANICPYLGNEIPNFDKHHLDPAKVYRLYRDPAELAKGAATFDGKPLLIRHVAISADLPSQELWVGTLGPCTFEAPYLLTRPLTVLTQEAIDLIDSHKQRELSAGYRYDADMTPGVTPSGERYDGRMVNIQGNHVAIVHEGRAGHDVHVADELPPELKPMRSKASRIIEAALVAAGVTVTDQGRLAMDSVLAFDMEGLGEVPPESTVTLDESEKKAARDEALEEKRKVHGKDAKLDKEEEEDCYDKAKDKKKKAHDEMMADKKAKDEMDKKAKDALANPNDHRNDFRSGHDSQITLTAAQLRELVKTEVNEGVRIATDAAVKLAGDTITKRLNDANEARNKVRPLVGEVTFDTAAEIYRFALKQKGVEAKDIHESALPALVDMLAKSAATTITPTVALDEAQTAMLDLDAMFAAPAQH